MHTYIHAYIHIYLHTYLHTYWHDMTWHYMTPHDITYTFAFNIHLHTHIYINIYVQYIYAGVQNYYKQNIMWGCHVPTCELYTHFMACLWEQKWPQITHNVWRTECDYTCSGQNTMWAADWTHTIWKQMPFWGDTSMREMFCAMCSDLPSITILKCSPCLYIRHVLVHVHGGGWFKNLASAKKCDRLNELEIKWASATSSDMIVENWSD